MAEMGKMPSRRNSLTANLETFFNPVGWNFDNHMQKLTNEERGYGGKLVSMVMGTDPTFWSGDWCEGPLGTWIEATFRGAGQVIFMDNPFSGVLIIIATLVDDVWSGLLGLVAVAASTLFGLLCTKDKQACDHGLHGYNAHLVGLLFARVIGCKDMQTFAALLLLTLIFAIFSNIFFIALGNVLVSHFRVPPLTLPFNIVSMFWIANVAMSPRFAHGPTPALPTVVAQMTAPTYHLNDVLLAIPKGVGQVWLCSGLPAGLLMWSGVLVCSPISAFLALLGSFTGMSWAMALGASDAALYEGIYGYNGVLGCIAVGGIFNRFNRKSIIAAMACAMLCTSIQFFVAAAVSASGNGVMTLPFCFGTLPFLLIGGDAMGLVPVPVAEATCPEEVLVKHWQRKAAARKIADAEAAEASFQDVICAEDPKQQLASPRSGTTASPPTTPPRSPSSPSPGSPASPPSASPDAAARRLNRALDEATVAQP